MHFAEPDFNQLKKLWTLKLVVQSGSLKHAASQSRVTVSAVSQTVSSLEKVMGRKLLVRKDRSVMATQYCTQVLKAVEPAFVACGIVSQFQVCSLDLPKMTWLSFGASESIAADLLPKFVKQVRGKLPKLKLTLHVSRCGILTNLVKKGDLCMALVTENDAMTGVSVYPIYEDRLAVYCAAQGPIAELGRTAINQCGVAGLLPEAEGLPLYYSKFLRNIDTKFRAALSSDNYETLYALAASGSMCAILPTRLANRRVGVLKEIPLTSKKSEIGKFKVSMISQLGCDPGEDEFLVSELRSLI